MPALLCPPGHAIAGDFYASGGDRRIYSSIRGGEMHFVLLMKADLSDSDCVAEVMGQRSRSDRDRIGQRSRTDRGGMGKRAGSRPHSVSASE